MANPNSITAPRAPGPRRPWPRLFLPGLLGLVWLLGPAVPGGRADEPVPTTNAFSLRAYRAYASTKARLQAQPTNNAATLEFARACFDWAEFATNDTQRAAVAEEGIAAGRDLNHREPTQASAAYYLALNLGQLARTKRLGALRLVKEMERLFKSARALDEHFDYAGPDRGLGLLYRDAPGWPLSLGSRSKARLHLRRALTLHPDYFENHLNLIESLLQWAEPNEAELAARNAARGLERARRDFAGEQWASAWADWDQRWRVVTDKFRLNDLPADRETPAVKPGSP